MKNRSNTRGHAVLILFVAASHLLANGQSTNSTQTGGVPSWKAGRRVANHAQSAVTPAGLTAASGITAPQWELSQSGPHSRTWVPRGDGAAVAGANKKGQQYVELASGMNFWDGTQWAQSVPEFQAGGDGFDATRVQHAVHLGADLYAQGSVAVKVPQSATGDVLYSTPIGIGLLEPASGQFALIASLTNSTGVLVESNCVLYPDAFSGDGVCASVEYRLASGSFSQNVIFTGKFNPADWGFSTNCRVQIITELFSPPAPEITRQPIYVESDPLIRSHSQNPDLIDEVIRFGELMLPTGHAFLTTETGQESSRPAIIAKEFRTVGARNFLIESVTFTAIASKVRALPVCATPPQHAKVMRKDAKSGYASIPIPAAHRMAALPAKARPVRLAKSSLRPSGLLLDYVVTIGPGYTTPAVFQSDTTYLLTGPVNCGSVILEAAIFKYPNSTGSNPTTAYIQISGTLTTKTSAYFPAIFTAADDDSVGQVVSHTSVAGPSGTVNQGVYYANPAIQMYYVSASLSNLRFRYCQSGVSLYGVAGISLTVSHSQFLKCLRGISLYGGCGCGCGSTIFVTANNNLMSEVQYPVYASAGPSYLVSFCQCTIDGGSASAPYLAYSAGPALNCTFSNSVLANIQTLKTASAAVGGSKNGFWNCPTLGSTYFTYTSANGPSPFQTGDLGRHYLTNNSGFQARGSVSIPSALLVDLKTRSTSAALSLPPEMYLTGTLSLGPQVPRYVSGSPDLGYYYPALDYSVGGMILDGAKVTVLPGTAIGLRYEYFGDFLGPITHWALFAGFDLLSNSALISEARPENPSVFAAIPLVQETSPNMPYWPYINSITAFKRNLSEEGAPDETPAFSFRFCQFYLMQNDYHIWTGKGDIEGFDMSYDSAINWSLRDCLLQGGHLNLGFPVTFYPDLSSIAHDGGGAALWVNDAFDRVQIDLTPMNWDGSPTDWLNGNDMQLLAYNNLFRGGSLTILPSLASQGDWIFRDNLFDKVVFVQDTGAPLDHDHNAYWPCLQSELYSVVGELSASPTATLMPSTGGVSDSSKDKTLLAAPGYQGSTFGNYYLNSTTPSLVAMGSRTPATAGLYHYTTTPNQTKDANQAAVNIGLHYIASASGKAIDSDGDGIPDYVENWHGDNNYLAHTDSETDWQNAQTLLGTADAANTVYDDVDLTGNGSVGRIKRALNLAPLSTSNPLTLVKVVTGNEPDVLTFKVPISYTSLQTSGDLRLLVDGLAPTFQECDQNADGTCLIVWNATFSWPGQHYLQAQLVLNPASLPNTAVLTAPGPLLSYYTATGCQFDPVFSEFDGSGANLVAYLPEESAQYSIEIRDSSGHHVRTISGSASGGTINTTWNLMYDDGVTQYTGTSADAVFTITPPPPAGPTVDIAHLNNPGIADIEGNFTIAYTWDNTYFANNGTMRYAVQFGAVDTILTPQPWPNGATFYNSTWNTYTYNGSPGVTGYLNTLTDADNLINNLVANDTRNFFFSGHGNGLEITDGPRNQVVITVGVLRTRLSNRFDGQGHAFRQHPYRFVFLDACQGADDPGFAHAFGIWDRITSDQLGTNPQKAQAFLSWFNESRAPDSDSEWVDEQSTYQVFFSAWMSGYPLDQCIRYASSTHPLAPFDNYTLFFPLGIKYSPLQNALFNNNNFRLRVYGYAGLTRTGFQPGFDQSIYYR